MKNQVSSVLLLHVPSQNVTAIDRGIGQISQLLQDHENVLIFAKDADEAKFYIQTRQDISCVLMSLDKTQHTQNTEIDVKTLTGFIRERNESLPIFLLTERLAIHDLPHCVLKDISDIVWVTEDDPDLVAARIEQALQKYMRSLLPPFFSRLYDYANQQKYSWHTPGHSGGMAYQKSPVGRMFYDFFGRNIFLSDLSSSVPELGSILEHEGVVKDAEEEAAKAFGSDRTYFVTNGTTMSNQIVFRSIVRPGDAVLVDRNCHKSIVNSCIMTGAIPIFLQSMRNAQGIIGPIQWNELEEETIKEKIRRHPLITEPEKARIRLAIITNSTYDGVLYNTERVLERLSKVTDYVLFDEAWIPYAAFADLYRDHFAMSTKEDPAERPTVISTMSTHKTLAAFSQASMIQIRNGRRPLSDLRFNEAFMMHSSTSPQYSIIASLDVATRMMKGQSGKLLMRDAINEAIAFRKEIRNINRELSSTGTWWFDVWQPDKMADDTLLDVTISGKQDAGTQTTLPDSADAGYWTMKQNDAWHGFDKIKDDYVMLDPVKVTVLTPGINNDGTVQETGIPASLVTTYLREHGVVVEKTGTYSFLVLFTIAVTRGKSSTLISRFYEFKEFYDQNRPVKEVLPSIFNQHPERYSGVGIKDLADEMHKFLNSENRGRLQDQIYGNIPNPVMTPSGAYEKLISDEVELVPLDQLQGRISAVQCLVYPPGIPVVVPGELFNGSVHAIVDYLRLFQNLEKNFPGFENEVHGIVKQKDSNGSLIYSVYCVKQ